MSPRRAQRSLTPARARTSRIAAITDKPLLIGASEAARELGVHVETLRRAVRDGRVPAVRLGERGWLRFYRADLGLDRPPDQRAPLPVVDQEELEWR
ncbi:MAG TPA: excisionase family DNA-binding protein [Gaiellaceae bacterium]